MKILFLYRKKTFFRKSGFPRFKNKDRFRSILFPQVIPDLSRGCVKLTGNKLKIFRITSPIKIKYHRPFEGIAKQCRIVKQADNFYLCISCDDIPNKPLLKTGKEVGLDLGLNNFVTFNAAKNIKALGTSAAIVIISEATTFRWW